MKGAWDRYTKSVAFGSVEANHCAAVSYQDHSKIPDESRAEHWPVHCLGTEFSSQRDGGVSAGGLGARRSRNRVPIASLTGGRNGHSP